MILFNIGLIPLDNRPCTMLFPVELGRIANINIYTPPEQYLGNFLQQGHPQYIYEWLEENIDGWDAVIYLQICWHMVVSLLQGLPILH